MGDAGQRANTGPRKVDLLRVACTACGATVGQECRNPNGRKYWSGHAARWKALPDRQQARQQVPRLSANSVLMERYGDLVGGRKGKL